MAKRTGVAFDRLCELSGLPKPIAEFRFNATRKWRFDWAWPSGRRGAGVALEIEGGVFVQGRHSRGAGMLKDMDKYNEAAVCGWRVLRVTPKDLESVTTFDLLRRALELQIEAHLLRCVRCGHLRFVTKPQHDWTCEDCAGKAETAGLKAVYEKYRHLDQLLRDDQWADTLRGTMLRECWIAICAAVAVETK